MPMAYQKLREAALKLPKVERAKLASDLLLSVDAARRDAGIEEAWGREISRRIEEIDSGKATLYSSEEVRRDMRSRLAKARKNRKSKPPPSKKRGHPGEVALRSTD